MKKHKLIYILGLICITLAPISAYFCWKSDREIYLKEMKYQIETFGYYKKDIICLQQYETTKLFNRIWGGLMLILTVCWLIVLLLLFLYETADKKL